MTHNLFSFSIEIKFNYRVFFEEIILRMSQSSCSVRLEIFTYCFCESVTLISADLWNNLCYEVFIHSNFSYFLDS